MLSYFFPLNESIFLNKKRINLSMSAPTWFRPQLFQTNGEKHPTAPLHQLIEVGSYYKTYSKINQIQSEVNNSI